MPNSNNSSAGGLLLLTLLPFIYFSTPTKQLLYFYRHFLSSVPNLNSILNKHRDVWCIRRHFFQCSLLVVKPTLQPTPTSILSNRNSKYNNIQFYFILSSILCRFPLGKWVPLGRTMEIGSKTPSSSLASYDLFSASF